MGAPIRVFVDVSKVLQHHGQKFLSQEQYNALVSAIGTFDWSQYREPETPLFPEDDDDAN